MSCPNLAFPKQAARSLEELDTAIHRNRSPACHGWISFALSAVFHCTSKVYDLSAGVYES